mmetsp:Transcript_25378/g.30756  ORF Transcript_25378/g.30756 Transcript_25378/m.30756 type:complete len:556 (-) Transcript_25378:141-1808(-)|eukprot:CAMPEP_0197845088 /NCGR_PEP_ID=MMETSP1438-20131217/2039_1 /TAXON_ID=1461541 /ORGANISM="Pterosperma sp., Strain CCMP1384" /LENGTH=555 /DNA_ID=CAMNT_0043456197 /DNA_START=132 /DNA_END=1799 /DNA_ORIENTATION=-
MASLLTHRAGLTCRKSLLSRDARPRQSTYVGKLANTSSLKTNKQLISVFKPKIAPAQRTRVADVRLASCSSSALPAQDFSDKEQELSPSTTTTTTSLRKLLVPALVCAPIALTALPASASAMVAADTAWMLTSTALVLFMTLPGLAAFYAGLCKRKNILSVLMQCFTICCIQTVLWFAVGYSLCFSTVGMQEGVKGMASFIGGFDKVFMNGVTMSSVTGTIPEALWAMYQCTFAVITPALMVGSMVERMKFNAVMIYTTLWTVAVYYPACHMIWGGAGGLLTDMGVVDFAGGIVVHITAGIGALVAAIVCGERRDNKLHQGNLALTMLGTGMLWVGWFGFNGGSAAAAGAEAAFAIVATQISAATAALVWMMLDIQETGKASLVGILTGSIAGLATITPAAGFVGPMGAFCLGVIGSAICRWCSTDLKHRYGYDDSLDVFGVHGVGGFVGTCLLGVFASSFFGGFGTDLPMMKQTFVQCAAAVACVVYTGVVSWGLLKATEAVCGGSLRVPVESEEGEGLDQFCHGESCTALDASWDMPDAEGTKPPQLSPVSAN